MIKHKLEIFRGDTAIFDLELVDEDTNTPIDLTNQKIIFTVKSDLNAPDTSALIQKIVTTHTDATNGKTEIKLGNVETDITPNTYYFDIQMVDTISGEVHTFMFGDFVVYADVTRTV